MHQSSESLRPTTHPTDDPVVRQGHHLRVALFDAGPRHSLIVQELCSCADATHRPPPPDCPCREGLVCASPRVHASRSRVLAFATRACPRARVLVCSHLPRVCCSRVLAFATRESLACARARVGQHLLRGCGWSLPVCDTATPVRSKSCLLYTSPSPRDLSTSRMPSSA